MGALFFVVGSVGGAVVAWFIGRRERNRSTPAAINGVAAGLLGLVLSASYEAVTPATEAVVGLLGTAVPLTLCMSPSGPTATSARISAAIRRLAGSLALTLVCGISCAALGFVSVEAMRYVGIKESEGKAPGKPIVTSPKPTGEPSPVHLRGS
jgi:hypothetical protein